MKPPKQRRNHLGRGGLTQRRSDFVEVRPKKLVSPKRVQRTNVYIIKEPQSVQPASALESGTNTRIASWGE